MKVQWKTFNGNQLEKSDEKPVISKIQLKTFEDGSTSHFLLFGIVQKSFTWDNNWLYVAMHKASE